MTTDTCVGIDLGTTYSVAAVVENGRPRVISDTGGGYTIPSIVAVDDKGNLLVGQAAKRQNLVNPLNTVYGAKRLVGRDIHSSVIEQVQKHFKYRITEGEQHAPLVRLRDLEFALEEIQALILDHIRNTAQDMLGREITRAVVTVPAYFNDRQRQAVRDAGRIAQLEVLRIINEPTAAALAYGYGKGLNQKAAVYDLGGGTFDVSILELRDTIFEVKATGGDTFLGGVDFDNQLTEYVAAKFMEEHQIDLLRDPLSHQRVQDACERAKIDLSTLPNARINIPYIAVGPEGPLNLDVTVGRDKFDELIAPLIQRTLEKCDKVMSEASLTKDALDAVLLVGGSTRVPAVARMVAEFFGRQPSKHIHPDEAVSLGAAIMADSIINRDSDIQLLDVLPINLGLALPNGKVMKLFERNASVPNQKMKTFTTGKDNQDSLKIQVVQGDSENVSECEFIGDFIFKGIHAAPRGKARVEAVFTIDAEGILAVAARDPDTGVEQKGQLQVSSSLQKTYKKDLIKPKKPAPRKEAQQVVGSTVTREKKLKTPPPPSAPEKTAPKKQVQPEKSPAAAAKSSTPPPPKPVKPRKPGLFERIKSRFAKPEGKQKK